jgi:hypothetical protein
LIGRKTKPAPFGAGFFCCRILIRRVCAAPGTLVHVTHAAAAGHRRHRLLLLLQGLLSLSPYPGNKQVSPENEG